MKNARTIARKPPAGSTAAAAAPALETGAPAPDREEVARLAYLYWEARGGQGGSAEEDWLRAEAELRSRTAA